MICIEILNHLDFAERTARQQQIDNADALESTLDWVWSKKHESRSSFAQWLLNDRAVFWIQGKPGSGKSTLMSYLEKASRWWQIHSRRDSNWSTIRFFFDFRAHSGLANNLEGFLRSLLFQILKQNSSSEDELHRLEEKFGDYKSGKWTSSALKEAFVNALRQTSVNMCILVDGLDEFSGNMHELMTLFHRIPSETNTGHLVKICLASRPHPVIAMALGDWPGLQMQTYNARAIEQYAFITMKNLGVAAHEQRHFSADIAKKAEGVFLWARFAVKEIIDGYAEGEDMHELYQRLEALPSGMEELYAYIFKRMNSRDHEEAQLMFQLVCFAQKTGDRSIGLRQLKEAVAIAQNDISEFNQYDTVEGLERFRKRVRAKCGGLLEEMSYEKLQALYILDERARQHYNKSGGTLKLIHRTAESYLDRQGWFLGLRSPQYPSPHALWLHVCCKSVQSVHDPRERLKFDKSRISSIFQYASYNIFEHARLMECEYQQSSFHFLEIIPPSVLSYLRERCPTPLDWRGSDLNAVEKGFDRHPWQILVEQRLPLSLRDAVLRECYTLREDGGDISLALLSTSAFHRIFQDKKGLWAQQQLSCLIQLGAVVKDRHIIECLYCGRASCLETLLASWPREKNRLRKHPLSSMHLWEQEHGVCMYNGESVGILYELVRDCPYRMEFDAKLLLLLKRGEILNEICGAAGTALHASIINAYLAEESFDILKTREILKYGACPNISSPRGTPVQLAWRSFRSLTADELHQGRVSDLQKVMTLLLEYGADASWTEPNGLPINPRTIEAWCAMSVEELIAQWEDDDFPYCKSDWDTYEFPLYHPRDKLETYAYKELPTLYCRGHG